MQPVPDDEPVFIIRAKDVISVAVLEFYRGMCSDTNHADVVDGRVEQFRDWQQSNPDLVKIPDTAKETRKETSN